MVNVNDIYERLNGNLGVIVENAVEQELHAMFPDKVDWKNDEAKRIAKQVKDIIGPGFANAIAQEFLYVLSNLTIEGMIQTNGGPTSQVALLTDKMDPSVYGGLPNSLKVSFTPETLNPKD